MTTHKAEHCMVCGEQLEYLRHTQDVTCSECGDTSTSPIICPEGHFVCDQCHSATILERLPNLAAATRGVAPEDILEELLLIPDLPMHGPEHHPMAGLALLLACQRQGVSLPENCLDETIRRCMQVPGGACGYLGACGGGVSLGVAVSMVTGATPTTGLARGLANRATAAALAACGDDDARCCKRALRRTVAIGRDFFDTELNIQLPEPSRSLVCHDVERNRECARERCPYFRGSGPKRRNHS